LQDEHGDAGGACDGGTAGEQFTDEKGGDPGGDERLDCSRGCGPSSWKSERGIEQQREERADVENAEDPCTPPPDTGGELSPLKFEPARFTGPSLSDESREI
jgi:hypothetical protein